MARWNDLLDIDNMLGVIGLERSNKASGVGSFFVGMGLGLIAGGVTAMLLTPYNGNETRERLLKAGEDLGKTVTEKVNELTGARAESPAISTSSTTSAYDTSYPSSGRFGA